MFRYLKALWYMITGRFTAAAEALQTNRHVMAATYDKAIANKRDRFNTVKNAVADLIRLEEIAKSKLKELHHRAEKLEKVKTGALVAMQRTVDELRQSGLNKEQIQAHTDFLRHNAAYNDATSTLAEIEAQISEKEADIESKSKAMATYKAELQQMQKDQEKLVTEKAEALADVAIAQETEAINAVLAGIESDTTDKDLASARTARERAKAKAKIVGELAGNDARAAESEYVNLATTTQVDSELDRLLNWAEGDKDESLKEPKVIGRLPEN